MLDNVTINVNFGFDIAKFAEQMADAYRAKGYDVSVHPAGDSTIISFKKNTRGIKNVLGLGKNTKATCRVFGEALNVSFSGAEWLWKMIAVVFGWLLLFIPVVTAAVGTAGQIKLPEQIAADAKEISESI